jgi:hypothetical protein
MPRVAKYVQITATSKVYSCELKVKERQAPTVLRRIRRCFLKANINVTTAWNGRRIIDTQGNSKLSVTIARL